MFFPMKHFIADTAAKAILFLSMYCNKKMFCESGIFYHSNCKEDIYIYRTKMNSKLHRSTHISLNLNELHCDFLILN